MNDDDIASLYTSKKIKALVSLTRGEGFGLPILEAAASGLPVIATNWSAYLDFMNLGKFISIDYSLVPIHETRQDNNIFMPGSMWANFNESDFREKILKFYKKSSIPQRWANELKVKIREGFCFESIATQYSKKFEKVLNLT
tara:strand:- start:2780 stop:3205 length:426 start_codon:yes stop_codon:yes gene_type:complete